MSRLYRVVCMTLCLVSLFSLGVATKAWADGGTASNPVVGSDLPLFNPAPQNKLPPPGGCRTWCALGGFTTAVNGGASDWGMGATCAEAQAAFSSAVRNKAANGCSNWPESLGWCNLTEVTGGCFFNGTMFQIDGYANYGCLVVICEEI
jgi:hypothetical protein